MKTKLLRQKGALFRVDIHVHVAVIARFHARSTFKSICVYVCDLQQVPGALDRGAKMAGRQTLQA